MRNPKYNAMKETAGVKSPGYILNEAAVWIPSEKRWVFLPRRVSKEKYDAKQDEYRCSNIGIAASDDFRVLDLVTDVGVCTY